MGMPRRPGVGAVSRHGVEFLTVQADPEPRAELSEVRVKDLAKAAGQTLGDLGRFDLRARTPWPIATSSGAVPCVSVDKARAIARAPSNRAGA